MNKTKIGPQPLTLYNNVTVFIRDYFDVNIFQQNMANNKRVKSFIH